MNILKWEPIHERRASFNAIPRLPLEFSKILETAAPSGPVLRHGKVILQGATRRSKVTRSPITVVDLLKVVFMVCGAVRRAFALVD